ncbi:hypothetical protein jhhlp_007798 [Lomentospora prolificans]|uniref:Uncharacterized protein n=1 Tax=Lomentospora prolificans TaxID=41688 RepID=A0A2N3N0M3_9PEZI|nr:hypothetical protein jhhlp_007798 [Lomentospora prolificans]
MATKAAALFLAFAAFTAASPHPIPPPIDEEGHIPGDCTMTVTRYTGSPIHFTHTVYTATETAISLMNCGSCNHLAFFDTRAPFAGGHGPVVTKTVTAQEPTTTTNYRCRPTLQPHLAIPGVQPRPEVVNVQSLIGQEKKGLEGGDLAGSPNPLPVVDAPDDQDNGEGCTTTLFTVPQYEGGPTSTAWPSVETLTRAVDCGGCSSLVTSRLAIGPGPQVFYTTTVTVEAPSTTFEYVCSATDGPLGGPA